jgi:hypothetical protein
MPSDYRHGIRTLMGDKAGDCVHPQEQSMLQDFLQQQRERNYASSKYEPLGTNYTRNHKLPDFVQDENFRFGIKTASSESAKNLITFKDPNGHLQPATMRGSYLFFLYHQSLL